MTDMGLTNIGARVSLSLSIGDGTVNDMETSTHLHQKTLRPVASTTTWAIGPRLGLRYFTGTVFARLLILL